MTPRLVTRQSGPLSGSVRVPGDKSITHRSVIFGAMAAGTTVVHGYLPSEDCQATAEAFRMMGASITVDGATMTIISPGWNALTEPADVIDCGNSGTTARLLTGLLAGLPLFACLTGDASLRRRPMKRVAEPLAAMGAHIDGRGGGALLPLAISGRQLNAIDYRSPVASAQVKTALLLAGLTARGTTSVTEPAPSRDHTERMLPAFGVRLEVAGSRVAIAGGQAMTAPAGPITVPGDISSAAFLIAAATLVPGSEVTIQNVGLNPTRTGLLTILDRMGAAIERTNRREAGGEPVADLIVRHAPLKGIEIEPALVPSAIDEFPILFALATQAAGTTRVRGADELRVKESDRIAAMARELARVGATVREHPDGLEVTGRTPVKGAECQAYGDHRLAMSMAVLGLVAEGDMVVDPGPIATSFPGFAGLLAGVGAALADA
ncbi:MAG: 3-phosphoshikimate 1-carboxyvinyltransferase [Nitrospirae bacterium]|nr:3-phosphoshikimate 1-carboxyvinyltransferase [Nitrospirota bacterium]